MASVQILQRPLGVCHLDRFAVSVNKILPAVKYLGNEFEDLQWLMLSASTFHDF